VEMFQRGRPFLDIDKKLGLKPYESRSYLIKIGLFKIYTVAELNKKLKEGEEW
jgi:hypothetical protein